MIKNIQRLPRPQRIVIFVLLFGGVLLGLVAITAFLILITFNTAERSQGVALVSEVSVREYATLPDDDAYPASVAASLNGLVYTGSYVSGAVWSLDQAGGVREIPNTREIIGAVAGLAAAPDGSLLVVDQLDADATTLGGDVKRVTPEGEISVFAEGDPDAGFLLPDDITLDAQGNVYVTDRGRGEVWRFAADGGHGAVWWPQARGEGQRLALTGLAYDPARNAIVISDSGADSIYRVALETGETETIYTHASREFAPGLDGVTVAPDGRVYVAAVTQNGIARLNDDGTLEYIVGTLRAPNDVDYAEGRLYVANFDSFSLVVSLVRPRLPFGIDVITLP